MMIRYVFLFLIWVVSSFAEESFLLLRLSDGKELCSFGGRLDDRQTPASTFKIPLSLMGYDAGILFDEMSPSWPFEQHYEAYMPQWKGLITPSDWMRFSVVWYSKLLAVEIGQQRIQRYLAQFSYGDQDASSGFGTLSGDNPFWIKGSLAISLREQVLFLKKMLQGELQVSQHALEKARCLCFKESLPSRALLYGKTGFSGSLPSGDALAYFVGWVEKEGEKYVFAYLNSAPNPILERRIPRVKELLIDEGI